MGLKRYMLFIGATYYASGGGYDFHASYDSLQEAVDEGVSKTDSDYFDWWHILDVELGKVIDMEEEYPNYGGGHC